MELLLLFLCAPTWFLIVFSLYCVTWDLGGVDESALWCEKTNQLHQVRLTKIILFSIVICSKRRQRLIAQKCL